MRPLTTLPLLAALVAAPAAAQSGGFTPGDLWAARQAVTSNPSKAGVVRTILPAGVSQLMATSTAGVQPQNAFGYDEFRNRLVMVHQFGALDRLWLMDGSGALTESGVPISAGGWSSLFPTDDGRIYMRHLSATSPVEWVDARGAVHVLTEADGVTAWKVNGSTSFFLHSGLYDPARNALFLANESNGVDQCSGGSTSMVSVRRLDLSADGSRVLAETCAQYDVQPVEHETPIRMSRHPSGQLLICHDNNNNLQLPRMMLVHPDTLAATIFASNGFYSGANSVNSGCWSSVLGKAVITNNLTKVLVAFAFGEVGDGQIVASAVPGTNLTTMLEIPVDDCTGGFGHYGIGLQGTGGVVPGLGGNGCPAPGSVVTLDLTKARGGATGSLFVGLAAASVPFKGGTFHVGQLLLTVPIAVGGAPGVAGAGNLILPAAIPNEPLLAGQSLFVQAGFKDVGAAKGASLTNGVQIVIDG